MSSIFMNQGVLVRMHECEFMSLKRKPIKFNAEVESGNLRTKYDCESAAP